MIIAFSVCDNITKVQIAEEAKNWIHLAII